MSLTNDQLVGLLDQVDVKFLAGGQPPMTEEAINPSLLLAALAMSDEARLRLAIIPLLLRHPEFAIETKLAIAHLPEDVQIVLKCYYTAAHLLQQKYQLRLQALFGPCPSLPNLFGDDLGLHTFQSVDDQLVALAQRHCLLSGHSLNWLGSYEHGAQRLLTYYERKQQWQQSQSAKSIHF